MRKPNYKFDRRVREIEKQEKKAAKLEAKRQKARDDLKGEGDDAVEGNEPVGENN